MTDKVSPSMILVPSELSEEQAMIVANKKLNHTLAGLGRNRSDYTQSQLNQMLKTRANEAQKRYAEALAFLNETP